MKNVVSRPSREAVFLPAVLELVDTAELAKRRRPLPLLLLFSLGGTSKHARPSPTEGKGPIHFCFWEWSPL